MDKVYYPEHIEHHWRHHWESTHLGRPSGDGQPYTIMCPPPNVTGHLHMGHGFQLSIMDALIRYHRMCGRRTLWQVGTDHAGIATQMVVERQLAKDGLKRHDMGREAFLDKVWQWKDKSRENITNQIKRLGASVDWDHERFTLDEGMSKTVQHTFIKLYKEGLIYRGKRLVNWDPVLQTAVSDLEVQNIEREGSLWQYTLCSLKTVHAGRWPLAQKHFLAIKLWRCILTMSAIKHSSANDSLPLCERTIPIIGDTYVDPAFGSGCVKITLHTISMMLKSVNVWAEPSTSSPPALISMTLCLKLFVAYRLKMPVKQRLWYKPSMPSKPHLHTQMVPCGDRSGAVLEPYLTDQWFMHMAPLAGPALDAVAQGIQFFT